MNHLSDKSITGIVFIDASKTEVASVLQAVAWCNQVVVIDDSSRPEMRKTVEALGYEYVVDTDCSDFGQRRNRAAERVTTGWILFIDGDETVSPTLQGSITAAVGTDSVDAYALRRRDFFWGRELRFGETWAARSRGIIRLYRVGAGRWTGRVHEVWTGKPQVCIGRLNGYLDHRTHPTIAAFLQTINRYSSMRAQELADAGRRASVAELMMLPLAKFIYTYVVLLGFADGAAGFVYSFMMAFHSFLVRAKLYTAPLISKTRS